MSAPWRGARRRHSRFQWRAVVLVAVLFALLAADCASVLAAAAAGA